MSKKSGQEKTKDVSSRQYAVAFCVQEDRDIFIKAVDSKRVEEQKRLNPDPLVFDGILTPHNNKNVQINVVLYNQETKKMVNIPTIKLFRKGK